MSVLSSEDPRHAAVAFLDALGRDSEGSLPCGACPTLGSWCEGKYIRG